jgi:hypothetical protein
MLSIKQPVDDLRVHLADWVQLGGAFARRLVRFRVVRHRVGVAAYSAVVGEVPEWNDTIVAIG